MVAQTADPDPADTAAGDPHRSQRANRAAGPFHRRPNRGGVRRLLAGATRLADLQLRIWFTEAKITAARIALYLALYAAAGIVGILAIIFFLIGIFHLLTDIAGLRPVWAYLIFGGFFAVLAGATLAIASAILHGNPKHDQ